MQTLSKLLDQTKLAAETFRLSHEKAWEICGICALAECNMKATDCGCRRKRANRSKAGHQLTKALDLLEPIIRAEMEGT